MTEAVNGLAWCLSTSAVPVSMDDFARIAPLREVWFRPTGDKAEPTPHLPTSGSGSADDQSARRV